MTAQVKLTIGVRVRWWVHPLIGVAKVAAWFVGPLLTEAQADQICARLARIVAENGIKATVK